MHLNQQQLQTLNAAIIADATANGYKVAGDTYSLLAWLNAEAPGPVKAWATLTPQDVDEATPWSKFDNIAQQGKRDSWLHAFPRYARDFSRNAVRKWVTDVWGNATAGTDSETILNAATRNALRIENILGGTAKTTGTVTALALTLPGACDLDDVNKIINL